MDISHCRHLGAGTPRPGHRSKRGKDAHPPEVSGLTCSGYFEIFSRANRIHQGRWVVPTTNPERHSRATRSLYIISAATALNPGRGTSSLSQ
jgi:hypothetical protein